MKLNSTSSGEGISLNENESNMRENISPHRKLALEEREYA